MMTEQDWVEGIGNAIKFLRDTEPDLSNTEFKEMIVNYYECTNETYNAAYKYSYKLDKL